MITTRSLIHIALFGSLTITGCTNSSAIEEPHIEKVHLFLKQGEQAGYPEAFRYLHRLDKPTQTALAGRMLRDHDPRVVYLGGAILVKQKRYDEAAPVMAALILNSRNEHDLQGRMDSDWRQEADPSVWPHMLSRVGRILIVSRESAAAESRKRAEHFLVDMLHLEVNKHFNREDAVSAVLKLNRALTQGNS